MNKFESLSEIIRSRRSIRSFRSDPVNPEIIEKIIESAVFAPSNNNRQGWKFYIITKKEIKKKIISDVEKELGEIDGKSEVIDEVMKSYKANFLVFKNAPILLIACHIKPNKFNFRLFETDDSNRHFTGELISTTLAVGNIMLLAEAQNIGTLLMTAPLIAADRIKKTLKIPGKYSISSFLCLGYYNKKPPTPERKSLSKITEFIN